MKISTDNSAVRRVYGDFEAMRIIKEAGFDGIDFTFYDMNPAGDLLELPEEERKRQAFLIREYAESIGLTFPQCHAELTYKLGESRDSRNYTAIIKSMQFGAWLGCPQIVIHTVRVPVKKQKEIDPNALNYDFMRSFLPYAYEYGIDIGVENLFIRDKVNHTFIGRQHTAQGMNEFVDFLNDPKFKVCCDLGHAAICGTEPQDFIAGMNSDRMTMLHVQDTDYADDRHWMPFIGKHNWEAITDALAAIDFKGYMNLEVLHHYDKFPKELLPCAVRSAAEAARYLADRVEAKKAALKA